MQGDHADHAAAAAHGKTDDSLQPGRDSSDGARRFVGCEIGHRNRRSRLPHLPCQSVAPAIARLGGGHLIAGGVAARPLPRGDEMHRLAFGVDLPVLGQLPVERAAQAFEHAWRGLVPAGRGDQCLGHREARGPEHLGPLAIPDVDRHCLQVQRFAIGAAHDSGGHIDPDGLAILPRVALLEPRAFLLTRHHSPQRLPDGRHVFRVRDVEERQVPQLGIGVPDELAEGGVDGGDVALQRGEGHSGLGLLEKSAEPRLAFALGLLHAMPLADVVDQREQTVLSFRGQATDGRLDLDSPAVFPDQRRLVAIRRLASPEPHRELLGQVLLLFRRSKLDQRRQGRELMCVIAGQRQVGVIAGDEAAVLRDQKTFADVADSPE